MAFGTKTVTTASTRKIRFFSDGKQVFESSVDLDLAVDDIVELYGQKLTVTAREEVLDLATGNRSTDFTLA